MKTHILASCFIAIMTPLHTSLPSHAQSNAYVGFSGDIKIIPPQHASSTLIWELKREISVETLMNYLSVRRPNLSLTDLSALNPDLANLASDAKLPAGTLILLPKILS